MRYEKPQGRWLTFPRSRAKFRRASLSLFALSHHLSLAEKPEIMAASNSGLAGAIMGVVRAISLAFIASFVGIFGAGAQSIDWEVTNRFRVITGEAENDRYISRILKMRGAGAYQPLILTDPN